MFRSEVFDPFVFRPLHKLEHREPRTLERRLSCGHAEAGIEHLDAEASFVIEDQEGAAVYAPFRGELRERRRLAAARGRVDEDDAVRLCVDESFDHALQRQRTRSRRAPDAWRHHGGPWRVWIRKWPP